MVRISPRRLRFDPDKLEEFIDRGGVTREADEASGMARVAG